MASSLPSYVAACKNGRLEKTARVARDLLRSCSLCPRNCGANRLEGASGVCKTGETAVVSSYHAHFGEESPLVGSHGSGTIFFARCNLLCVFCQNFDISHQGCGYPTQVEALADMMLILQDAGCHNINLVTPTHVIVQILDALKIAVSNGLNIPLIYNSSGYDRVETLKLLDGIIDIYMPDFKFWNPATAKRLCNAEDYPEKTRAAIKEMHRQVGDLVVGPQGLATRGLLIRHLVLPSGLADTREIMGFIAREISRDSYVNIMSQYRPCGQASKFPELSVPLSTDDYKTAVRTAREEGITRIDQPARRFAIW